MNQFSAMRHPSGRTLKEGAHSVFLGPKKLRKIDYILGTYFPFDADRVADKMAEREVTKAMKDETLVPRSATHIKLQWKQFGFLSHTISDVVKSTFIRAKNAEEKNRLTQLDREDFKEVVVDTCIAKCKAESKAPAALLDVYMKEMSRVLVDFYDEYEVLEMNRKIADVDLMVWGQVPVLARHRKTGRLLITEFKSTSQAAGMFRFGRFDEPSGPETLQESGVVKGASYALSPNDQYFTDRRLAHLVNEKGVTAAMKLACLGHIALRNDYFTEHFPSFSDVGDGSGAKKKKSAVAGKGSLNFDDPNYDPKAGQKNLGLATRGKVISDLFDIGTITLLRDPESSTVVEKTPVHLEKDMMKDPVAVDVLEMVEGKEDGAKPEDAGKAWLHLERPLLTISQLKAFQPSTLVPAASIYNCDESFIVGDCGSTNNISIPSAYGERMFFDSILQEYAVGGIDGGATSATAEL